jgi:hypothetical protein
VLDKGGLHLLRLSGRETAKVQLSHLSVDQPGSIERRIRRKADDAYTVNFPQFVEVLPGKRFSVKIDLAESCWGDAENVLQKGCLRLRFEYEASNSSEALKNHILTGRMISNWIQPKNGP